MTTSYKTLARVTVVLDVEVTSDDTRLKTVDDVRTMGAGIAAEIVSAALKHPGACKGVHIANWPEGVAVELTIMWKKGK